jgi:hypothetical protein
MNVSKTDHRSIADCDSNGAFLTASSCDSPVHIFAHEPTHTDTCTEEYEVFQHCRPMPMVKISSSPIIWRSELFPLSMIASEASCEQALSTNGEPAYFQADEDATLQSSTVLNIQRSRSIIGSCVETK